MLFGANGPSGENVTPLVVKEHGRGIALVDQEISMTRAVVLKDLFKIKFV